MKHQLFKANTYVEIDVGRPHLTVVGQIKDSTISNKVIRAADTFNIPQEAIELEHSLLIIPENPEAKPYFIDNPIFMEDIMNQFNGLVMKDMDNQHKLFAAVSDFPGCPNLAYRRRLRPANLSWKRGNLAQARKQACKPMEKAA